MFHGQNGHNHESWTSQKGYSDKYIIVYTNGRTVQGQARPLSTSKVDVLNQAKVQGAFSTYRMLYLIAETITKSQTPCLSVWCVLLKIINLTHVGDCWKFVILSTNLSEARLRARGGLCLDYVLLRESFQMHVYSLKTTKEWISYDDPKLLPW